MFKTIYLDFQSKRNDRRHLRFHTEQHCIIVSLLFCNPVRQEAQDFAQSEHDWLYRSRCDLYQVNIFTIPGLWRQIQLMKCRTSPESQLRGKEPITENGDKRTGYNKVLFHLCIVIPRNNFIPLGNSCPVYHISSVSIIEFTLTFQRVFFSTSFSGRLVLNGTYLKRLAYDNSSV